MAAKRGARRASGALPIVIGFALVIGAGAIAWYGTRPAPAPRPAPEAVTVPGEAAADPESPSAPAAPRAHGALPTRVVVASAGIDAPVREVGIVLDRAGQPAWETAWRSAGHHLDSARPGQPGNVVITGHVSVADPHNLPVFKDLDRVQAGDVVEVYTGDEVYRYQVEEVRVVEPADVRVLRSDHVARVTLITCTSDLKHRLVVTGRLV